MTIETVDMQDNMGIEDKFMSGDRWWRIAEAKMQDNGDIGDRGTDNVDGGRGRDVGQETEEMWGRRILRFLDDYYNGRRRIMTKDESDIEKEAGKTTKRAQEQG